MNERWLPVVGWEGLYEVSVLGRVRRNGRVLSPARKTDGHLRVELWRNNKGRQRFVHHLVLEAFVGLCPPGQECLHSNDIGDDNQLDNLRWGTRSANRFDMVRNGRHPMANKTHCKRGHEFTLENTITDRYEARTARRCRACDIERKRRARQHV